MKKRLFVFITLIVTIIIVVFIISNGISILKKPCPPPQRVETIPQTAFWIGGCDGGLWYELNDVKDSIYSFKIYNDYNGNIIVNGNFKANDKCYENIRNKNIQGLISHSTNEKIYLTLTDDDGKYCFLELLPNK